MNFDSYTDEELLKFIPFLSELGHYKDIEKIKKELKHRKDNIEGTIIDKIDKLIEEASELGYELYIVVDGYCRDLWDYKIEYRDR